MGHIPRNRQKPQRRNLTRPHNLSRKRSGSGSVQRGGAVARGRDDSHSATSASDQRTARADTLNGDGNDPSRTARYSPDRDNPVRASTTWRGNNRSAQQSQLTTNNPETQPAQTRHGTQSEQTPQKQPTTPAAAKHQAGTVKNQATSVENRAATTQASTGRTGQHRQPAPSHQQNRSDRLNTTPEETTSSTAPATPRNAA